MNGPSDWIVRCLTCGLKSPAASKGVFRWGGASKGKCVLRPCDRCGKWRCHAVKRV